MNNFLSSKTEASSPGKLILAGEHVVLYGYKALAFPIDRSTNVLVQDSDNQNHIKIHLKNFNKVIRVTRNEVLQNDPDDNSSLIALRTLKIFFERFSLVIFKGLDVFVNSQVPIGGFGSSTSVSCAIFKALLQISGIKLEDKDLISILIDIESINGVKASGLDQTVVVENAPISFEKKDEEVNHKRLFPKNKYIKNCIVIDTGRSNEITSKVVTFVRNQYVANVKSITKIFDRIGRLSSILEILVQNENTIEVLDIINSIGDELIKLGIVTPYCQSLMSDLRNQGASVKISGAGAITGNGSGALICFSTDQGRVIKYLKSRGLNYFQTMLF